MHKRCFLELLYVCVSDSFSRELEYCRNTERTHSTYFFLPYKKCRKRQDGKGWVETGWLQILLEDVSNRLLYYYAVLYCTIILLLQYNDTELHLTDVTNVRQSSSNSTHRCGTEWMETFEGHGFCRDDTAVTLTQFMDMKPFVSLWPQCGMLCN